MSNPAQIFYLTGQRKRKRSGKVKEVKEIGGAKLYRIVKRWKESWIKESDLVNVEIKTEAGESLVDQISGRDKAANEVKEFVEALTKGVEAEMGASNIEGQGQADAGIPQVAQGMASGEGMRVCGTIPDMFPEIASSRRYPSQAREIREVVNGHDTLPARVSDGASMDRSESGRCEVPRAHPPKLELANLSQAEIDKLKKQIYRGARSGRRELSEFSSFIRAMAEKNDTRFFIKLAKALSK